MGKLWRFLEEHWRQWSQWVKGNWWRHAYSVCKTQLQANCGGWNVGQSEVKGKEIRSESWHGWRQIAQALQAVEDIVFFSQWDGKLLECFKQRSEMISHKFLKNCLDACIENHQLRSRWPVRNVLAIFQAENKDSLDEVLMTEVVNMVGCQCIFEVHQ